jgi:uncharacterized protein YfaQ (DUF2300 family)
MKKNTLSFVVKAPQSRTRAHMVLFTKDTPFRPQRVDNKKAYRRQDKHPGRGDL